MSVLCLILAHVFCVGLVAGGQPEVNCPAPRSPPHGQSFLYQEGQVVKYVCESGYQIQGKDMVRCVDGQWEDEAPICVPLDDETADDDVPPAEESSDLTAPTPLRPLFNWGDEEDEDDSDDHNTTSSSTEDDLPLGDQGRVRTVVYPNRLLLRNAQMRRAAMRRNVIELEEEDKKHKDKSSTTAVRLQSPPSMLYLRRRVDSGKSSDKTTGQAYRTALVEQEGDREQPQGDKGGDAMRQYYWWAAQNYYYHPQQSSALVDYTVHPYGLTESQLAWINSLHPELRDQYLRDVYGLRTDEAARTHAYLSRYGDAYGYYHPYYEYYRQPMARITQDIVSQYDYSCNQAGSAFVRAPKLRNAHIAKYDRRQNPNSPRNHYLAAVYRCNPGYVMYDTRYTDLFCSKRSWIGTEPLCVRA